MTPQTATRPAIEDLVRDLLRRLGEDPTREGLLETPHRVEKALKFLTQGYDTDVDAIINDALFTEKYDEMVVVKDIEMYSLCEHHMLPFFGVAHVAYIPDGRILGLSKIPRVVEVFARRLQVQERLTQQVAEVLNEKIRPKGIGVVIEAQHLCMMMRGVEKQRSSMTTSAMLGCMRTDSKSRLEFLNLIKSRS